MSPTRARLPTQGTFIALDADGEQLPSDWYLRVTGEIGQMLRGERPVQPLILRSTPDDRLSEAGGPLVTVYAWAARGGKPRTRGVMVAHRYPSAYSNAKRPPLRPPRTCESVPGVR